MDAARLTAAIYLFAISVSFFLLLLLCWAGGGGRAGWMVNRTRRPANERG